VNPDALAERLASLREAGVKLRRRPAADTLAALQQVFDGWADPMSSWRRALETELPVATGFTAPVVREGARRGFGTWGGAALRDLIERELGSVDALDSTTLPMVSGFDTTSIVLAGQVPMPTVLALLAPLVLRSPVLAKSASRDSVTAGLVKRSLSEIDADLASCLEVVSFAGDDDALMCALLEADCVVATGSDDTIASIAARVRPPRRLVASGHRFSLAALGPEATTGDALERAAVGLALDASLWDQLGCLSPIAVYVVERDSGAADRVAEALARALDACATELPRGRIETSAAAAGAQARAEAELREAAGQAVTVHSGPTWTVVREADALKRTAPLHRFVRVSPLTDTASFVDALAPASRHLAGVALDGFGDETQALARNLADLGASRICAPGALQAPPLTWRHEGRGVLAPLARFSDLEASRP
jgi:hypothetical protein